MKIGLSTYSLRKLLQSGEMDVPSAIRWIAENGGEHVEIVPSAGFDLSKNPDLVGLISTAAAETGLEISSYTIGADFLCASEEETDREIERVKGEVDIAAALGVRLMRHDAGSRPMEQTSLTQFEEDLPTLVRACRAVAEYAARHSITTSVENHGHHVQHSSRVRRLVEMVDRPNFRTTVDIGNFICVDQNPVDGVRENAPLASMVHVKDFYYRRGIADPGEGWARTLGGSYRRGAIVGHGDVDVRSALAILREAGYDGYLSVEFEGMEDCRLGSRLGMEGTRRLLG